MPVPAIFKRQKSKPAPVSDAFNADDGLLQLHAETAELLRLVKTPAAKRVRSGANVSPQKRPVRQTIEVLEDDEEEEKEKEDHGDRSGGTTREAPASTEADPPRDPFTFEAEEARVRVASDTFLPHTSPAKREVERQRSHLAGEHARLERLERRAAQTKARHAYETEHRVVVDRIEVSAIKIQAHSRGFLARKHADDGRKKREEEAARERGRAEAASWHEVRDVERGDVWFYNALTGQSQWERPAAMAASHSLPDLPSPGPGPKSALGLSASSSSSSSTAVLPRVDQTMLPPLSPSTSRPNSSSSSTTAPSSSAKRTSLPPVLSTSKQTVVPFDYAGASSTAAGTPPWDCDSVADSASDLSSLYSERLEDDDEQPTDASRGRRAPLVESPQRRQRGDAANTNTNASDDDDWQINDALFLADGSKNSKLRDTIRQALQTSKFDSVSSLVASNVVLRRKPVKGRRQGGTSEDGSASPTPTGQSPNQRNSGSGVSRSREIVLGRREAPLFVAVLDKTGKPPPVTRSPAASTSKTKAKRAKPLPLGADPDNPLASAPQIRDLVDPGLYEDLQPDAAVSSPSKQQGSPAKAPGATTICFNCWSSSNGRHCDAHVDASDLRKIKSAESALMCANWKLDQLRRKYRAEEIQEIFMKQSASLRYDKRLKQYVTVIEARHPIYRLTEHFAASWSKTMRRKLHTRAWFRSFIEQLRAGAVPKADAATPKLMKLKNTLQNHRWCSHYSDSVRAFHPVAPVTAKTQSGTRRHAPLDVILIDPGRPQLGNWILKTDCTRPVELYRPRKYELPPRRCVPMPTPSFLEDIPLPVPNVFIDCGHIASWFERLGARIAEAAIHKALLQVRACSPPRGATDARRTKHVTPVVVLFATFGRKPTTGMLAVGGLTAELLIHMLVTTYIPAQYGHFVVFDRRALTPQPSKDHDATFVCLEIDAKTMAYVYRALEHALNVRRPPCITIATTASPGETIEMAQRRFPANRPEQTGEELAHGFRTFWLVDAFAVPDEVACVSVEPTADVLSPNVTSMNATQTTKADRFYPFCIATTKENTPIEFIHLLWIGQSSRNQPQTFTTLGAQQPGDFMKNSDPHGALGACTSVIYRSWAYMQSSPFEEFCTDDGIAYWYDKHNGETFWSRPVLPIERHRGKDGDIDGVVVHGQGEVATLGVGVDQARYSQHDLRKYMTKKLEAPDEKDKRIKRVAASARKHELVVSLETDKPRAAAKQDFATVQVPKLAFRKKSGVMGTPPTAAVLTTAASSPAKAAVSPQKIQPSTTRDSGPPAAPADVDASTKQLIASITQALGSALPSVAAGTSSVDMLQLGIGLGMGLGLRTQQQLQNTVAPSQRRSSRVGSSRSTRSTRPRSADSQVTFADDIDEGDEFDEDGDAGDDDALLSTTRSNESGPSDGSFSARSIMSVATSVDVTPSPDELELLPEAERAKFLRAGHDQKTPGYRTHPPPGEGHSWVDKPIDSSAESQTAVEGFGGALHQRVACLPKDFVAAVNTTKTCKMQANYLPVIKNTNQPRSVGIVRPRPALDEWLPVGYSPWSAGRSIFGTQFIKNLMQRPEVIAAQKSGNAGAVPGGAGVSPSIAPQVEKKENVTQAVKEAQHLETVFSLCRHGKYDELERMITSPDWTLDIEAKDVTGNTLLSIACQNNNKRIAKLCLRRGADVNTQNLNGQTVLHYCHEYGFHDLMDYLLDKGARDDIVNADGLTCYEGLSKEAVDAI